MDVMLAEKKSASSEQPQSIFNITIMASVAHPQSRTVAFLSRFPVSMSKRPRSPNPCSFTVPSCCSSAPRSKPAIAASAAALATSLLLLSPAQSLAKGLLSTNTIFRRYLITDSNAILRYSLPIPSERFATDPIPIRRIQEQLERLGVDLRSRGAAALISGRRDLQKLSDLLSTSKLDVLLDVPAMKRQVAAQSLSALEKCLAAVESELGVASTPVNSALFPPQLSAMQQTLSDAFERRNSMSKKTNFDAVLVEQLRQEALRHVYDIEQLAVEGIGLPFKIPRRYNSFPRLVGRASMEIKLHKHGDAKWKDADTLQDVGQDVTLTAILDGFSAPITAANFIDIAQRGYYDKTRILAAQKDFFVQLGEREDDNMEGFADPKTGRRRQIPLEILVDGEPSPTYGATLDEVGIGDLQPVLPASAFGALAMVHSVENANDASSQFYMFILDPSSYQARSFGGSILTGSLSTFGYVEQGKEFLKQIEVGDEVVSVRMISGEENFVESGDN